MQVELTFGGLDAQALEQRYGPLPFNTESDCFRVILDNAVPGPAPSLDQQPPSIEPVTHVQQLLSCALEAIASNNRETARDSVLALGNLLKAISNA